MIGLLSLRTASPHTQAAGATALPHVGALALGTMQHIHVDMLQCPVMACTIGYVMLFHTRTYSAWMGLHVKVLLQLAHRPYMHGSLTPLSQYSHHAHHTRCFFRHDACSLVTGFADGTDGTGPVTQYADQC